MDQLKRFEQIANRIIALAGEADELRARNSRQIKKAGASILEAIERQRAETQAEIDERRQAEETRKQEAFAEVEALAKSYGLEVTVKVAPKPKPKKVAKPKAVDNEMAVEVVDLTGQPASLDPKVVREWATQNGLSVSSRGAIPARVREAYMEATAS